MSDIPPTHSAERAATLVTYLVNPLALPPVFLTLAALHAGAEPHSAGRVAVGSTAIYFVLPVVILLVLKRTGSVDSIEVRRRSQRVVPYVSGTILCILAVPLLAWAGAPFGALMALFATWFAVNLALLFLINRRMKISVHAAGIAGFAAFLLWTRLLVPVAPEAVVSISLELVAIGFLLVPVVGWSRIVLRAHTRREVLAGTAFGILMSTVEVVLSSAAGLLP